MAWAGVPSGTPARYNGAAAIALVDAHAHATDADDTAYPAILGERCLIGSFNQYVRSKTLHVEVSVEALAQLGDRLSRDERQREGIEDAAVLFDHGRSLRPELCCQCRVRDVELSA